MCLGSAPRQLVGVAALSAELIQGNKRWKRKRNKGGNGAGETRSKAKLGG